MNGSFPYVHFAITIFIAIFMPLIIFLLTRHFAAADRKRDEMLAALTQVNATVDKVETALTEHLAEHRTVTTMTRTRWWR